jgi:hypothetical protein
VVAYDFIKKRFKRGNIAAQQQNRRPKLSKTER